MQVSFGSIKCIKEGKYVSPCQRWLSEMTVKSFGVHPQKEYAYGADISGKEIPLHKYLKDKKDVDVVITAKDKSTEIEVALKKTLRDKTGTPLVTYNAKMDNIPLKINMDVSKLCFPNNEIKSILAKFVKKCLIFARK